MSGSVTEVRAVQPENAFFPTVRRAFPSESVESAVQPSNAPSSISVTPVMVTEEREVQPRKAFLPTAAIVSPSTIPRMPVFPAKRFSGRAVSVAGNVRVPPIPVGI